MQLHTQHYLFTSLLVSYLSLDTILIMQRQENEARSVGIDGVLKRRMKKKRPREIAVGFRSAGCDEENKCCSECGKRFGSPKALYGHMRCHPERQWRGINPHQPARLSSPYYTRTVEEQDSGGGGDDMTSLLAGEHEVAACLLLLANGSVTASAGDGEAYNVDSSSGNMGMVVIAGHTCNICMRAFSSGHKKCHWERDDFHHQQQQQQQQRQLPPLHLTRPLPPDYPRVLDLNSPTPAEQIPLSTRSSRLNLELSLG